ncbi:protein FAM184A-like [Pocillopora damicornis]|uniref:protein FAM184A-like n=1 Tax=Pocillopora damicornis TaxID=46731 RepID=UPI000F556E64|nr:protein FAM184A-like [Pocillopora damicornis]
MAASKTASSFHSMPHRNGTYVASHGGNSPADVTPDLHLKMSKKIAQLTKVIYALNTKNDEHENVLENMKTAHEEEMQKLMAETKERVNYFKTRLNAVSEQRQKIDMLESHLSKERLQREEAMSEFESFKRRTNDEEARLKSEFSDRILTMSKELLTSKKEFEERLKDFQATRKLLEENRDKAVEELTSKHHDEIDQLMKAHRVRYDEVVKEKQKLEKEFQEKLSRAETSSDAVAEERHRIESEYQEKLDKLKAFYEKELAASRTLQENSKEFQLKEWEKREKALKTEWNRQERIFKDRISELLNQLSDGEQHMSILKTQLNELESKLEGKEGDSTNLAKQLEEARQEGSKALKSLRETESNLTVSKKRCEEQEAEIARQSMQISKLDATKLSQETTIKELKANITSLQSKLNKMESEHDDLGKKFSSHTVQTDSKIMHLQQEIEKLLREKEDLESKYNAELKRAGEQSTSKEFSLRKELEDVTAKLKRDHSKELEDMKTKLGINHNNHVMNLQQEFQDNLSQKERELLENSEQELERLRIEKNEVIAEFENHCSDLKNKLRSSEDEVERLEKLVHDSEKGLGSASSHIDSLKTALSQTKEELQKTKTDLQEAENKYAKSMDEMYKLEMLHDKALKDAKLDSDAQLASLTNELDTKWSEKLRDECSKLRSQLNEQHREENRVSLEQLTKIKDLQREELRGELQSKIDALKKTIAETRGDLEKANRNATTAELDLRKELDLQRKRMEEEISALSLQHNKRLEELIEKHKEELKKLEGLKDEEMKERESALQKSHRDEITSQLQANKLMIDAVKSQAEQTRMKDIEEIKIKHENDQENMRSELLRVQQEEMQRLHREFEVQLAAVKLQLQRTNEMHSQDETEHQNQIEELRREIEERECHLKELDEEIGEMKSNVEQLQRELQAKGQEILSVRREANSQMRKREEDLARSHQKEVDSIAADHLRETQSLLAEFNRSKELLCDKISALQLMLEEAEEKFRSRQSRPEDLEVIEQLKRALAERELDMKRLVDEKRYFQLELLNRETNFNKVFKAAPNIGVINPLQAKTKPGKEGARQSSSLVMSSSRLDPIPNMPVHEKRINNSRPLPPTPPKEPPPHRKTTVY